MATSETAKPMMTPVRTETGDFLLQKTQTGTNAFSIPSTQSDIRADAVTCRNILAVPCISSYYQALVPVMAHYRLMHGFIIT